MRLAAAISADPRLRTLYGNPGVNGQQLAGLFTDVGGARFDEAANIRFAERLEEFRRRGDPLRGYCWDLFFEYR